MKRIVIATFILLCASCATNKLDSVTSNKVDSDIKQHTAVLSLAVFYYCEYKKWPESLLEIQKYQSEKNIKVVNPYWDWILSDDVKYSNSPSYSLLSNSNIDNGIIVKVSSGQKEPVCNNGKNEIVGAYMNVELNKK